MICGSGPIRGIVDGDDASSSGGGSRGMLAMVPLGPTPNTGRPLMEQRSNVAESAMSALV